MSCQVKKAEPKKKGVDCGPGSGAGGYRDGRTGGYGDQLMMMQSLDDNDDHCGPATGSIISTNGR